MQKKDKRAIAADDVIPGDILEVEGDLGSASLEAVPDLELDLLAGVNDDLV